MRTDDAKIADRSGDRQAGGGRPTVRLQTMAIADRTDTPIVTDAYPARNYYLPITQRIRSRPSTGYEETYNTFT